MEVREEKSGKKYVKDVKLAEDKKSAEVELYEKLADGTYTVKVTVGEESSESVFAYEKAEAKTIELAAQSVVQGKKIAYKVLDANGVDITSEETVEVVTDKPAFFEIAKGSVTLKDDADGSAFAKFVVKKENKVIAESARVRITAESKTAVAKKVADYWTLADASGQLTKASYEAEDFKVDSTVNMGGAVEFLTVSVLDQFGKDKTGATVNYKSLDEDVLIADKVTGKITPLKEGTAPVEVTLLDGTKKVDSKIVQLTVAEKAKLVDLKLDKTEVNLSSDGAIKTTDVKVEGVDQFGDKIGAGAVTAKSADTKVATSAYDAGKVTITAVAEGTTTVTVKAGEIEKTITVVVEKAGDVAEYKVEGFRGELLYKNIASTEDIDETEMEIKVTSYDEAGTPVANLTYSEDYTIGVKDKNGDDVVVSGNTLKVADFKDKEGPFAVVVKVGTLPVFEGEFKVTDNRVAPTLSIKDNNLVVNEEGTTFKDVLKEKLIFKNDKNVVVTPTIDSVKFVSTNEAVISQDADLNVTIDRDGTAAIKVSEIKVTVDGETFTIKLNNEHFNVKVTIVETAAAKQEFLEELDAKVAEKIPTEVAKYTREDDNLTVEFVTDDLTAIKSAAEGLAEALMESAYGSTLYIGENKENKFVLDDTIGGQIGGLAGALFSASGGFDTNGVLTAPYSADIIYNEISGIILDGNLIFSK